MCGIIGYIPYKQANGQDIAPIIKTLSSRGYDSQGIVLDLGKRTVLEKCTGKFSDSELENILNQNIIAGIAHTRWATQGKPTIANAHPHYDPDKRFYIVMNGIIENEQEQKTKLKNKGYKFLSETDTEIIPLLFHDLIRENFPNKNPSFNDILNISNEITTILEGSFAYLGLDTSSKHLIAYKRSMPVIIGKNDNGIYFSSQIDSLPNKVEVLSMKDEETAAIHYGENN